jgi:hypothetical protein
VTVTIAPDLTLRLYLLVCPTTQNPDAVVPTETEVWFPVADTVTQLPDKPEYDTEPELVPANSAVVDECFDPDNVDTEQIFNNFIPEGDTAPIYDVSVDTDVLIQPKNELIPVRFRLRSVLTVLKANYSTKPKVVSLTGTLRSRIEAVSYQSKIVVDTTDFQLTVNQANLYPTISAQRGVFAFDYSLSQAELLLNPDLGPFTWDVGTYSLVFEAEDLLVAQFDTDFSDSSGYNTLITSLNAANILPVISNEVFKFGGGSLDNQPNKQAFFGGSGLQWYLNQDKAPSFDDDFLFESWINLNSPDFSCIWATDTSIESQFGNKKFELFTEDGFVFLFEVLNFNYTEVLRHPTKLGTGVWYHVALQRRQGQCTIYINGVPTAESAPARFSLKNRHILGNENTTIGQQGFSTFYGYFDGVRITVGSPRPDQGFSVPATAPRALDFSTAALSWARNYSVNSVEYVLSGGDVAFSFPNFIASLQPGDFTLEGFDVQFKLPSRSVVTDSGTYLLDLFGTIVAPSIVGNAIYQSRSTGSMTISYPSTIALNDLIIVAIETDSNGTTPLLPPTWQKFIDTPVSTGTGALGTRLLLYWKRVTSLTEPSIEIGSLGDHVFTQTTVWRNVKPSGIPLGTHTQGFNTAQQLTHTAEGITTTTNSSRVLVFSTSAASTSSPWGTTPINSNLKVGNWQRSGTTIGNGGGISLYSGIVTAPRDIGNTSVFLNTSFPDQFTYYTVELLADSPPQTAEVSVPLVSISIDAFSPVEVGGQPKKVFVPSANLNIQANDITIFSSQAVGVPAAKLDLEAQIPSISTGVRLVMPVVEVELSSLVPSIIQVVPGFSVGPVNFELSTQPTGTSFGSFPLSTS